MNSFFKITKLSGLSLLFGVSGCSFKQDSVSQENISISAAVLEMTPETKYGHQLYWQRGRWFNIPKEYKAFRTHNELFNATKEDILKSLSKNAERNGFDIETGKYNPALVTKSGLPLKWSFCREGTGKSLLSSLPIPCDFIDFKDRLRRGAVHVRIDWPGLAGFEKSFNFRPYKLALTRAEDGSLTFLDDVVFPSINEVANGARPSEISFFDEHQDHVVSVDCSHAGRQDSPDFWTCHAYVWNKATNFAFQLDYGSIEGPRKLSGEWKMLALKAHSMISEFSIGEL